MGAVTAEQIEQFANKVLSQEFPQYCMKWTTAGPICINKSKTIYIDKRLIGKYPWVAKECILHECAHINSWPKDSTHGEHFYKEYIRLLQIFIS